jgi:hypothetical protein
MSFNTRLRYGACPVALGGVASFVLVWSTFARSPLAGQRAEGLSSVSVVANALATQGWRRGGLIRVNRIVAADSPASYLVMSLPLSPRAVLYKKDPLAKSVA